jgi:hypothetical protein
MRIEIGREELFAQIIPKRKRLAVLGLFCPMGRIHRARAQTGFRKLGNRRAKNRRRRQRRIRFSVFRGANSQRRESHNRRRRTRSRIMSIGRGYIVRRRPLRLRNEWSEAAVIRIFGPSGRKGRRGSAPPGTHVARFGRSGCDSAERRDGSSRARHRCNKTCSSNTTQF